VFSPQFTPEELAQWLGQTLRDIDFQPLKGTSVELANVGSIRMYAEAGAGFEKGVGSQQIISVFTFTAPLKQKGFEVIPWSMVMTSLISIRSKWGKNVWSGLCDTPECNLCNDVTNFQTRTVDVAFIWLTIRF